MHPKKSRSTGKSKSLKQTPRAVIHARLIGIDTYLHSGRELPELRGAIKDVEIIEDFLKSTLGVPDCFIRCLRNNQATRRRIVDVLEELAADKNIVRDEPILIYFAGHGTSISLNGGQTVYEAIVPYDAPVRPEHGSMRKLISDVKLGHLLGSIAEKKGNNITVILDCCHSASMTRTIQEDGYIERRAMLTFQTTDDDVSVPAEASRKGGFLNASLQSHVLLAACARDDVAREYNGEGLFTQRFVKRLTSALEKNVLSSYTYLDLISEIGILPKKQTPHCEGMNKDRSIFSTLVRRGSLPLHHVTRRDDTTFEIKNAGELTGGIRESRTEFAIYRSREAAHFDIEPLGYLLVDKVEAHSCTAHLHEPKMLPTDLDSALLLYARQIEAVPIGSIKVRYTPSHLASRKWATRAIASAKSTKDSYGWDIITDNSGEKDVELGVRLESLDGRNAVAFDILDQQIHRLGLTRFDFTVPDEAKHLEKVFRASAHFFWHLRRTPELHRLTGNGGGVEMRVYELKEGKDLDENLTPTLYPAKKIKAVQTHANDYTDIWKTRANDGAKYGVELRNNSKIPCYVSLLYFDCSDASAAAVGELYGDSAVAHNADLKPQLEPGKSLRLYGPDSGAAPLQFELSSEQSIDVSILKVILSNAKFDVSQVKQDALSTIRAGEEDRKIPPRESLSKQPVVVWDEITLPVVQTR